MHPHLSTAPIDWSTALAEALDNGAPFVVDVRTSIEETFQRVTAPLANTTY